MENLSSYWCVLLYIFLASSNIIVKSTAFDYEMECGISSQNENFSEKIVNGVVAKKHEFPWLISIQLKVKKKYLHNCGGAIIHSQFVLTAGHCLQDFRKDIIRVAAGKFDLKQNESTEEYRDVKRIIIDDFDASNYRHDIALIQVDKPFELSLGTIAPICLPLENNTFYNNAIVAGWGKLHEGEKDELRILRKVMLPFISQDYCKNIYTKKSYDYFLHDCQMCTLDNEGKDSCQGDSGGPVMCGDKNDEGKQMYVCGIISWGAGCGQKNAPSVSTDVKCFIKWISDKVNEFKSK